MQDLRSKLTEEFVDKEYAHAYMDSFLIDRLSTQIYQLREQRKWTQKRLEKESGIAQEKISLLESGEFSSITLKTLRALASAFDVAISIRFESFTDAIDDFLSLSVDKLQVDSRVDALTKAVAPTKAEKVSPSPKSLEDIDNFISWSTSHSVNAMSHAVGIERVYLKNGMFLIRVNESKLPKVNKQHIDHIKHENTSTNRWHF